MRNLIEGRPARLSDGKEPLFIAECLPPPTGGTWATKDEPRNNARLLALMKRRDITQAFLLHPVFNGHVGTPKSPWVVRQLDEQHQLLKSRSDEPLEGYEIAPGNGVFLAAGGCMLLVAIAWMKDGQIRMVCTHAGRDSLIDRGRIMGEPPRRYEGVLYAIAHLFKRWGVTPHRTEVHGLFSIAPSVFVHPLNHPEYGVFNRAMLKDVQARWGQLAAYEVGVAGRVGHGVAVDQHALLSAQAEELGIFATKCYPYLPPEGPYVTTHDPNLAIRHKRNLIILRRFR